MLGSVIGLGAALLIAGCGAGQITQTDRQVAAIDGASVDVRDIAIRNAELAFPGDVQPPAYLQGSDAEVLMSIVNRSGTNDELVSIESDEAANVSVQGDREVPAGTALNVGPTEPGAGRQLHAQVTLEGLTREVRPGQTVKVTLTFRDAGDASVELPIKAPAEPRVSEHDEEGGH
ncbi:copper chaperone PCu(A)C [Prauserella sp. ASG 168]|uniref:Copper chaperone PCu(A)C n=2 Tax=Prauserella cavernicola TaxID=2800127 RepID=A0A934V5K7_9PSEU|nr:copper chaperone PCu(A)C [Prauserella cavernicola]